MPFLDGRPGNCPETPYFILFFTVLFLKVIPPVRFKEDLYVGLISIVLGKNFCEDFLIVWQLLSDQKNQNP